MLDTFLFATAQLTQLESSANTGIPAHTAATLAELLNSTTEWAQLNYQLVYYAWDLLELHSIVFYSVTSHTV